MPSLKYIFYITFIVKCFIATLVPLAPDEYYYWLWGQYPQWSYFDHPPMVGWIMWASDNLRSLHPGALRWPFIAISYGSIWLLSLIHI